MARSTRRRGWLLPRRESTMPNASAAPNVLGSCKPQPAWRMHQRYVAQPFGGVGTRALAGHDSSAALGAGC
eukprot:6101103-Pleurochrysis_carterae.AAC.2